MKLKKLQIQGYKNLEDITIDFSNNNGTTLLVGNNGCGKSNILEAISSIFGGLYKDRIHKPHFDYHLEYRINNHDVDITLHSGKYVFSTDNHVVPKTEFTRNASIYLPTNIISCYSGESSRLWGFYYYPYYKDYIKSIKTSTVIPQLPLIYINKFSLEIALLTLFFYDFSVYSDIASFCSDVLNIRKINKILFHFESLKFKEWKDNSILQMIKALCQVDDIADVPNDTELTVEEIKNNLNYLEANQRQFFYYLYGATMPKDDKLISEIKFEIELNNGTVITIDDFSEGEKKNLLIQFILETVADENSLILFDEPDSHIHVSRKVELKNTLDKYPNRENIWTTHSPSLASAFGDNHIIGLGDDTKGSVKIIDKENADLISYITNGMWDIHQQNVFLSSNKPVTLLVEGLTDKQILAQAFKVLKDDYKSLKFDVFHCGGADNIPHLLTGLRTTDFKLGNKKIIALFDSDTEGLDCCNRSQVKYSKAKNKKGLYAIVLPKKNATIESFFPTQKFNDAYTEALSENPFNGSVTDFSKNLMTKSKIKLSENCKNFAAQDFDEFRSIFDLLEEINNL